MRKSILVIMLVFLLFGSLIVFLPEAGACHNKSVTIDPGTEQDIVDFDTHMIKYEIDVKLTPGCGNQYWVGFNVDPAPTGWSRILYKKGDASKTSIIGAGSPSDGDHNNWAGWISAGSGSEVHYYATLEVKVNPAIVDNGESATITVHCFSCDNVPNDLEDDPVTTTTTLNIPFGIRMYHYPAYYATREVNPGETANFNIYIKDIGDAYGLVDLSKSLMSAECFDDDWVWKFSANPVTLPQDGTVQLTLSVTPPLDAEMGETAIFIVDGKSQADDKFIHSVSAKTVVVVPLPDLSVVSVDMDCMLDEVVLDKDDDGVMIGASDGDTVNICVDVYNLGEIDVSNFEVIFKLTDPGNEQDIGTVTITETLSPNEMINVQYPWTALEGDHSICVHPDEKNLIVEKDEEGNNEAGLRITVGPPKPKSIVLTADISPLSCMPGATFTVSGGANYNKEYDSLPVEDTNVEIKIIETDTIFNIKTDSNGEYSKECTAPTEEESYNIQVSITKDSISAKTTVYLTVSSFQINVLVTPRTALPADDVVVKGQVSEGDFGVPAADVTIKLLDTDNTEMITPLSTSTDTNGAYNVEITAPTVTEYTEYYVEVTATKDVITGSQGTKLFVDIDTDSDLIGNEMDTDDDGDEYPDDVESPYDYDPLDNTDKPTPIVDLGDDQEVNEGEDASFDAGESYSPVSLDLISYVWDFGDGTILNSNDYTEESEYITPTHTYDSDGDYDVVLTIADMYGSDSALITVTVNDLGPTATIEGPTTGETSTPLDYTAQVDSIDTVVKYEWDWDGDGTYDTESTDASTDHQWLIGDDYTIKLRVTDSDGSQSETEFKVTITKGSIGTGDGGSTSDGEDSPGKSTSSSDTTMILGLIMAVIVVIILIAFFMMRKKKPAEVQPDQRVGATNFGTQDSRKPTTQFADADIKPAMGAGAVQQRPAVGTVPQQQPGMPAARQQQPQALPPTNTTPTTPGYPAQPQQQRDWNWNFNE